MRSDSFVPTSRASRERFGRRAAVAVIAAISLAALLTVASTWNVFSQTTDEPAHIAAGMELVDAGSYTIDPQHPPLARALFALGPWLEGARFHPGGGFVDQGNAVLYCCDDYVRILSLARAGNLPFLILGILVVAIWCWRLFGPAGAVAGTALYATLPPVLAHSGVATTDMAAASTIAASLLTFDLWLERRTPLRSALLGAALAAAVLAKLSAVAFVPLGMIGIAAGRLLIRDRREQRRERRALGILPALATAALTALLVVWAVFRFSFGVVLPGGSDWYDRAIPPSLLGPLHAVGDNVPLPAPELLRGVLELVAHSRDGHFSYLLGEVGTDGWWYYFPVAIGIKTPIPFLVLALGGILLLLSRPRMTGPLLATLAMLALAMSSSINIGIRHILPIYPLLAILAAGAFCWLASRRAAGRIVAAALLAWQVGSTAASHPDHLPWFNAIVGDHPERWLLDSNLDWGQDLLRLEAATQQLGIDSLALSYFGTADPARHDFPPLSPVHDTPTTGWVAVSLMNRLGPGFGRSEPVFVWLDAHEPRRIGASILLYEIPAGEPAPLPLSEDHRLLLPILLGPEPLADPRGPRLVTRVRAQSTHAQPVDVRVGEEVVSIAPGSSEPAALRRNRLDGQIVTAAPSDLDGLRFEVELVDLATGRAVPLPSVRMRDVPRGVARLRTGDGDRERSLRLQAAGTENAARVRVRVHEPGGAVEEQDVELTVVEPHGPPFASVDLGRSSGARTIEIEPLEAQVGISATLVEVDPVSGAIELRFRQ